MCWFKRWTCCQSGIESSRLWRRMTEPSPIARCMNVINRCSKFDIDSFDTTFGGELHSAWREASQQKANIWSGGDDSSVHKMSKESLRWHYTSFPRSLLVWSPSWWNPSSQVVMCLAIWVCWVSSICWVSSGVSCTLDSLCWYIWLKGSGTVSFIG